jgi:hypothetical protein
MGRVSPPGNTPECPTGCLLEVSSIMSSGSVLRGCPPRVSAWSVLRGVLQGVLLDFLQGVLDVLCGVLLDVLRDVLLDVLQGGRPPDFIYLSKTLQSFLKVLVTICPHKKVLKSQVYLQ